MADPTAPALTSFADIPREIRRRIAAGERVALILLDAFGLRFVERHADHPLVAALDVTPLRTQFPSTTTAHVTTVHFGVPVEEHGLYEWNVLEPSLDEIISPLLFSPAGAGTPLGLFGRLDPAVLAPGPSFYESLGVHCTAFGPSRIAGAPFGAHALAGANAVAFDTLEEGAKGLADALRDPDGPRYVHLYWDLIDATGHLCGPSSTEFDAAITYALDTLWAELEHLEGATVLFTADHGQVDVHPDRVDPLDELWPELPSLLTHAHPAGSARDVFLHVREGEAERVIATLQDRLEDRARVVAARELFGATIGPRLEARLADVCVLPAAGREAWLSTCPGPERKFLGHHGGLDPAESETFLGALFR